MVVTVECSGLTQLLTRPFAVCGIFGKCYRADWKSVFLGQQLDQKSKGPETHQSAVQLHGDMRLEPNYSQASVVICALGASAFRLDRNKPLVNSRRFAPDSHCAQFSSISALHLCLYSVYRHALSLCARLSLGAARLYNRLAGPPFQSQEEKRPFLCVCVDIPECLPRATVKLSHFQKLNFHKSNHLHREITSLAMASHCSLFSESFYKSVCLNLFLSPRSFYSERCFFFTILPTTPSPSLVFSPRLFSSTSRQHPGPTFCLHTEGSAE